MGQKGKSIQAFVCLFVGILFGFVFFFLKTILSLLLLQQHVHTPLFGQYAYMHGCMCRLRSRSIAVNDTVCVILNMVLV